MLEELPETQNAERRTRNAKRETRNALRLELNHLEEAELINSRTEGNKKVFQAIMNHPLYGDIHCLFLKHIGIDHVVENVVPGRTA